MYKIHFKFYDREIGEPWFAYNFDAELSSRIEGYVDGVAAALEVPKTKIRLEVEITDD